MIIINITPKLIAQLKALNYKYKSVKHLKELLNTNIYKNGIVIIGSKFGISHNFLNIRELSKRNFRFIIELNDKHTIEEKKIMAEFEPLAFIPANIDSIELRILLNSITAFDFSCLGNSLAMSHVIEQIPIPIFIKNNKGRFISCNKFFCDFSGYSLKEILGASNAIMTTNKKALIYDEIDQMIIRTGENITNEAKIVLKDKSITSALVNRSAIQNEQGETIGILGVLTDISHQKDRVRVLKTKKQKAIKSDKLKTSFLSNMSHEIRTPMNAIVGFSQLLGSKNINSTKKQQYIEQINHNASTLLKLIEDIIEISKIEADKIKIDKNATPVNDILDEIYSSFKTHRARMGKNHIKLYLKKDLDNSASTIISDPYRLKQILTNLLGNAFKFTEEGNITFGYKLKKDNKQRPYLVFFVKDTGIGINKEKLKYIFDRFSKVPAEKTKLYGGTGLGLSISKKLTTLLGGQMQVASKENKGTTFTFTLPYIKADNNILKKNSHKIKKQKTNYFWNNKTMFIAEDQKMNYLYLNEILKDKGLIIHRYKNGEDFLKAAEKLKPDIVLMDIKMPRIDGYEATRKFKKLYPDVPVIIQTAYAMQNERKKGFNSGGDQYLEKPVNEKELLAEIERFLQLSS